MGQTKQGDIECEKLKNIKGNSYEIDLIYENWDKMYGTGTRDFSVYVLTDGTRIIRLKFGPYLEFNHQPFYVGSGRFRKRVRESMGIGRQQDKYTFKTARLNEIIARGGKPRPVIIGHFYTEKKAQLVERKVMNTIGRSFLENGVLHYCELPLTAEDCNVIYNRSKLKIATID